MDIFQTNSPNLHYTKDGIENHIIMHEHNQNDNESFYCPINSLWKIKYFTL